MDMRNPYEIDPYGSDGAAAGDGATAPLRRAAELVGCLLAMAALFFGMIYLMGRVGGR